MKTKRWAAVPAIAAGALVIDLMAGPAAVPVAATSTLPDVGALLSASGTHFCTASVVNSPAKDVVVTAAHCAGSAAEFAPGYHDGTPPYGLWKVTRVFVDPRWTASSDPDEDVAFLTVDGPVQNVTGGNDLGTGRPAGTVRVIGYPDSAGEPISCQNTVKSSGARQMEFDCAGYTDGTSGGPFLTPDGTVAGVIGGYEQGGDTPDVSYSVVFGADTKAVYDTAAASGENRY